MRVRMDSFELSEDNRRAIRFNATRRRTPCSRKEAKAWIQAVVDAAIADLEYRWSGGKGIPAAVANGADPDAYAKATANVNAAVAEAAEGEDLDADDAAEKVSA